MLNKFLFSLKGYALRSSVGFRWTTNDAMFRGSKLKLPFLYPVSRPFFFFVMLKIARRKAPRAIRCHILDFTRSSTYF